MVPRDLTTGSIPRRLFGLATPMMASSALHSFQSMVDMYFVSRLGSQSVAAVGMSGASLMVLITLFMGLHAATVAMVARAIGAGDERRAGKVAAQALLLAIALAVLVSVAGYFGSPHILRALNA